jgi:hypothetical protein
MYEFQRRIRTEAAKYQIDENTYDPARDGLEGMQGSTTSSDDTVDITEADQKVGNITFRSYKEGRMQGWILVNRKGDDVAFLQKQTSTASTTVPHLLFLMKDGAISGASILKAWPEGKAPQGTDSTHITFNARGLLPAIANWFAKNHKNLVEETDMKNIDEASAFVVANQPKTGSVDKDKETKERLLKYRVPMSFIANFKNLRKKKESMPGSRIMWSKDDQDLDVIPAKDVEIYMSRYGWVMIESIEEQGNEAFAFVTFTE